VVLDVSLDQILLVSKSLLILVSLCEFLVSHLLLDIAPALKQPVLSQTALKVLLLKIEVISKLGMPRKVFELLLNLALLGKRERLHWSGMRSCEDTLNSLDR